MEVGEDYSILQFIQNMKIINGYIFLTVVFVVISVFDGNIGQFSISDAYVPVYQTLLMVVYSAYFAGRSIEKVKGKSGTEKSK